jgi:hypothetical protein
MVVKSLYEFDVPAVKVPTFLRWLAEVAVPYFKKLPEIQDIHYNQATVGKPLFVKVVTFEELNAWTSLMNKYFSDPKMQEIMGIFFSYTANLESKLVMEVT